MRTTGPPSFLYTPVGVHLSAAPWTYKRKGRYSHKYSKFNLNIMSRSCLVTFYFVPSDSRVLVGCGNFFFTLLFPQNCTGWRNICFVILIGAFWKTRTHSVIARKNRDAMCAQSNYLFCTSGVSKKSILRVHVAFLKKMIPSLLMSNSLDGIPCNFIRPRCSL